MPNKKNKSLKDLKKELKDINTALQEMSVGGEAFEMLTTKYSNQANQKSSITYMNNGQVALNGKWLREFFLDLFRVRFFDKVLDNRTKDLLNKVELLD